MSSTKSDNHLRLVPLTAANLDSEQQGQVLTLAAQEHIRLFVRVPPGQMAYADTPPRIATQPSEYDIRRSRSLSTQQAIDRARHQGHFVIAFPEPRPEITFLALAPLDAQSLLAARSVSVHWFMGGLRLVSGESMRGFLEPASLASVLCLRPEAGNPAPGPWIDASREHTLQITWSDVLVSDHWQHHLSKQGPSISQSRPAAPTDPQHKDGATAHWQFLKPYSLASFDIPVDEQPMPATQEFPDPHEFRKKAPGVLILYVTAMRFFAGRTLDEIKKIKQQQIVESLTPDKWKASAEPEHSPQINKLLNEQNTRLAFKFVNPLHKRTQGGTPERQVKPFNATTLAKARAKYQDGGYISDSLALIMHASDRWHDLLKQPKSGHPTLPSGSDEKKHAAQLLKLTDELNADLKRWGFATTNEGKRKVSDERGAIMDFVIWPLRIADLRAAIG